MKLFKRHVRGRGPAADLHGTHSSPVEELPPQPEPESVVSSELTRAGAIAVSRTLVKSEPELAELVASEPLLASQGVAVSLGERGFGTRVAITAEPAAGLSEEDLESLLDELAEPKKRPFSNS
jgi:hypothetical protein